MAGVNHDFVVSEQVAKLKNLGEKLRASKRRGSHWMARHGRRRLKFLAVSIFAATAVIIPINALIWQKNRHSAPLLFSRTGPVTKEPRIAEAISASAVRRARPVVLSEDARPKLGEKPAPQKSPDEKPTASGAPNQTFPNGSLMAPNDQISEVLKVAETPPARLSASATKAPALKHFVLAAQHALVKLGFVLKPDGVAGPATRQAIMHFERARGLPVRGELTPSLVRQLKAEAGTLIN